MDLTGGLPPQQAILFYILSLWSLIWKGLALWKASKYEQRNWFIVILVVNTVSVLEIIYLFRFAKKRMTVKEIKSWFQKTFFTKSK